MSAHQMTLCLKVGFVMACLCIMNVVTALVVLARLSLLVATIKKIKHHDFALSQNELDDAEFLMCCNSVESNIEIELDLIDDVKSIVIQNIDTKVKSIHFINKDMAVLTLRTPRSKTLQFMAGQDVELSFKGNASRCPLAYVTAWH